MKCRLITRSLMFISVMIVAGCASVPESVQLPDNTPLVDYQQVAASPATQKDKMARWGGVIADIQNKADKTQLDVVFYPLRAYGRPIVGKESIGRFRVYVDGFLDPMVYQKGRSVTFAGQVTGVEKGMVGEHVYQYPTMAATGHYLWEDIDRIEIETISVWPHFRYGFHPFGYNSFYGWHHWPHYQRHVIKRKRNYHQNHHNNSAQPGSGSQQSNVVNDNGRGSSPQDVREP